MKKLLVYVVCLSVTTFICHSSTEETFVKTSVGTFKGYVREFEEFGNVYRVRRFLGVPYAEPPIEDLRFVKPVRKARIDGVYDATQWKPFCIQTVVTLVGKRRPGLSFNDDEDCLYLNIFAPEKYSDNLPVLVHFHGGGFVIGGSRLYPGDVLSAYGDIIVVTVNYRLSVWGFLSTGDANLPGNYGLFDQHEAIMWVHDHIAAFGGDPGRITVSGHSAGAASAVYQSLYPKNAGIVKRAIGLSGSITCPWAFNPEPIKVTKRFAKLVGCNQEDTKQLADCIRSKPSSELHHALNDNNGFITFPMEFVTTIDGEFVPENPHDLLYGTSSETEPYRLTFEGIDLLAGVTSGEGYMNLDSFCGVNDSNAFTLTREQLETREIPKIAQIMFGEHVSHSVVKLLISEYTNWKDPSSTESVLETFISMTGDYVFNVHTVKKVMQHAARNARNTYLYYFDASTTLHLCNSPDWATKPNHGDELFLLFGFDSKKGLGTFATPYDAVPKPWEYDLAKVFLTVFANFIKSGYVCCIMFNIINLIVFIYFIYINNLIMLFLRSYVSFRLGLFVLRLI